MAYINGQDTLVIANLKANLVYADLVNDMGYSDELVMTQKAVTSNIMRQEKRITNIEQGITPSPFETDDSIAYIKNVPLNALPYAEVNKVGGMTYNDGSDPALKTAKVTKLKIVGANLIDINNFVRNTGTPTVSNDTLTVTGYIVQLELFDLKIGETYTFKANSTITNGGGGVSIMFYDTAGVTNASIYNANTPNPQHTFTVPSGTTKVRFCLYGSGDPNGNHTATYTNVMLNKGSTALPYTPYTETLFPIPTEVQEIDGYGWGVNESAYNYIDFEEMQFVKRVGVVDVGTLNWKYYSAYKVFLASLPLDTKVNTRNFITHKYNSVVQSWREHDDMSAVFAYEIVEDYRMAISIRDTSYTDAAIFKAAMSGAMLYYELAEPIITDIADFITAENFTEVEGGGEITFVNEYGYDVPSEITYMLKGATE